MCECSYLVPSQFKTCKGLRVLNPVESRNYLNHLKIILTQYSKASSLT